MNSTNRIPRPDSHTYTTDPTIPRSAPLPLVGYAEIADTDLSAIKVIGGPDATRVTDLSLGGQAIFYLVRDK